MYPAEWLNSKSEVNTSLNFHVAGRYDVFALGDIISLPQTKTGMAINMQAPILIKNLLVAAKEILKMRAAGTPTNDFIALNAHLATLKYQSATIGTVGTMLIPIGSKLGAASISGYTFGSFLTRNIKGGSLFSEMYFSLANTKPPSAKTQHIDFADPPLVEKDEVKQE